MFISPRIRVLTGLSRTCISWGMPRKPRIEYKGAVYHVMSRGNRGEAIFRDDSDHETFLETLGQACSRAGWLIHA